MPDVEAPTATAATPAKKSKAAKPRKPAKASTHPKASLMVDAAIIALKERHGSSLAAIKKYINANYKVDNDKISHFIRRYLKSAVASGKIVQTKGIGANGSFRMKSASSSEKAPKKTAPKKTAAVAKKPKPAAAKKAKTTAKPKKAASPKKKPTAAAKKAVTAKKPVAKAAKATPKKVKATPKKAKKSPVKKAAGRKAKK